MTAQWWIRDLPCWCSWCKGRVGVHGAEATAHCEAEARAALAGQARRPVIREEVPCWYTWSPGDGDRLVVTATEEPGRTEIWMETGPGQPPGWPPWWKRLAVRVLTALTAHRR